MTLKEKAANGFKWTAISAIISVIIQLLLVLFLTRVLTKNDFGLMAIATFIIGFSQIFVDMGISNSIIHKEEITEKQLNGLYWLNILTGVIIFVIIYFLAYFIADFYNDERLIKIIHLTSITFLIQPWGIQFAVLLQKNLNFKSLAIRDVFSKLVGLVVGCYLGYNGYGIYSLVFSNIVTALAATILLIIEGVQYQRPKLYFNYNEIKPFLSFGLFQMGEKILNYFNSNIDGIIIGRFLGMDILGSYSVAKNLVMRPAQIINPIITKVSFPIMAKFQNEDSKLKGIYTKTLSLTSFLNFPIYIFIAIFSDEIVLSLFGENWIDTTPILRILSLYFLVRSTVNPIGSLLMAKGEAKVGFLWNLFLLIFVPISVYIGSFWSIIGVCYAFLLLQLLLSVPVWKVLVNRLCGISLNEYYLPFSISLLISFTTVILTKLLSLQYSFWLQGPFYNLIAHAIISSSIFVVLNYYFNKSLMNEFKMILPGGKKAKV